LLDTDPAPLSRQLAIRSIYHSAGRTVAARKSKYGSKRKYKFPTLGNNRTETRSGPTGTRILTS